jgi:hypothetical protein
MMPLLHLVGALSEVLCFSTDIALLSHWSCPQLLFIDGKGTFF